MMIVNNILITISNRLSFIASNLFGTHINAQPSQRNISLRLLWSDQSHKRILIKNYDNALKL